MSAGTGHNMDDALAGHRPRRSRSRALELRRRLGMPERASGARVQNVVVASPGGAVALLVDRAGDVLTVSADDFESAPETLRAELRALVRGAYKLPDRLLLVLDHSRVTQVDGVEVGSA